MKLALLISTLLTTLLGTACSTPITGGYSSVSSTNESVIAAAEFAVTTQAAVLQKETPSIKLQLIKIKKAEEQVVAGTNYQLILDVTENGKKRTAKAIVWHQSWRTPDPYQLTSWEWTK